MAWCRKPADRSRCRNPRKGFCCSARTSRPGGLKPKFTNAGPKPCPCNRGECGMDDLLDDFLDETNENLDALSNDLVAWEKAPADRSLLDGIFRFFHTIKGNSRSEEHTSDLQSLMRNSYAFFCLTTKKQSNNIH